MKKLLTVVLAIAVVVSAIGAASAFGPGSGMGMGGGYGNGYNSGSGNIGNYGYSFTPQIAQQHLLFEQAVYQLRVRLLELKMELLRLQAQSQPDSNAISAKQQEMFDIRTQILQQAINFGIAGYGMY